MILYHFTARPQMNMIWHDGFIKTVESNIGSVSPDLPPYGEHVGPDVVWLTDVDSPDKVPLGDKAKITNKREVRLTVDVPDSDVEWWPDFATEQGINPEWRRYLEGDEVAESWWVVRRPITIKELTGLAVFDDRWAVVERWWAIHDLYKAYNLVALLLDVERVEWWEGPSEERAVAMTSADWRNTLRQLRVTVGRAAECCTDRD